MRSELVSRFEAIQREVLTRFERTAALENHWLIYTLLGWQHLATCGASHFLLEVKQLQHPVWPYLVLWGTQILVALGTIKLVSGRPRVSESPIEPMNKRIWTMFLLLAINVCILNVAAGQPIFAFMPTLATLSAFAFTCMTILISRRFMAAGLTMVLTGITMARLPHYQFLIYGAGWWMILQALGLVLWNRRRHILLSWSCSSHRRIVQDYELAGSALVVV